MPDAPFSNARSLLDTLTGGRRNLRVLVCGGRDYGDTVRLYAVLDRLERDAGIAVVIHGAARGADSLAGAWAHQRGIEELPFPADWRRHRKAAGMIRNAAMLQEGRPDLVVAFPGGRGTEDMVAKARTGNVPFFKVETSDEDA